MQRLTCPRRTQHPSNPLPRRSTHPAAAEGAGGETPKRPSLVLLGSEPIRAALEFVAHRTMRRPSRPVGDGHPVIVFPGLASDERAVRPLRDHCRRLGYDAHDWGRGFNVGPGCDVDTWLRRLSDDVERLLDRRLDRRATLVGWSLGGLYARELAKRITPRVRAVVTIGTPFNADADHTHVGWLFRLLNRDAPAFDAELSRQLRTPPPVPTTSIYSKSDGIVAWQTCRHDGEALRRATVEDIEIQGSHVGMGWNPEVLNVVADRLAQKPGAWRPWQRRAGVDGLPAACEA